MVIDDTNVFCLSQVHASCNKVGQYSCLRCKVCQRSALHEVALRFYMTWFLVSTNARA